MSKDNPQEFISIINVHPGAQSPEQFMYQYTMPYLLKLREKELNGTISPEESREKDQILIILYNLIKKFGFDIINQMTSSCYLRIEDREDIQSSVKEAFFAHIYKYDPFRVTPTVFFVRYFREAVRNNLQNIMQVKPYDSANMRLLRGIISNYEVQGIPFTNDMLANDSGLSLKVVKQTMELLDIRKVAIEEEENIRDTSPTPESYLEEIEMDNAVKRVLMDELEPDEARLLLLRMNIGEKRDMPYESIARIVGSDVISVRKKLNQIRKKLRKSTFVRNQWPAQWEAYNARQNKLREEETASGPTYCESVVDMMESSMLENFRRP